MEDVEKELWKVYGTIGVIGLRQCPIDGVEKLDGIMGLSILRQAPYQVQMWLVEPNKEIHDHSHPNVDTLLVYISGRVEIRIPNLTVVFDEVTTKHPKLCPGSALFVPRGGQHGLSVGSLGGAFLSVQKWDGPIQSTDRDWQGQTLGPIHAERLAPERSKT